MGQAVAGGFSTEAIVRSYTAGGTIARGQGVVFESDGDVVASATANSAIGVALDDATSGDEISVVVDGPVRCRAGAALTFTGGGPHFVSNDTDGNFVVGTPGLVNLGRALLTKGTLLTVNDLELFEIIFSPSAADAT